jgi:hypothetical protein
VFEFFIADKKSKQKKRTKIYTRAKRYYKRAHMIKKEMKKSIHSAQENTKILDNRI